MLQSSLELQLGFLDSSLDQFVEGSDAGRLIDSFLILAEVSFCLDTEGVGLIGIVLMWTRRWDGPLQTCSKPISLSLPDSRLASWMCLRVLEDDDLLLEFIVLVP